MPQTDAKLNPTTLKIFYLLRSGVRLSRNKHFELFRDPKARYARRLHRLFSSLCSDLEAYGQQATIYCALEDSLKAQALGVHIEIPIVSGRRTVFLTSVELALFADYSTNNIAEMLSAFSRYALETMTYESKVDIPSFLSRSGHQ